MPHICVSESEVSIGSDNGLSPIRRQAIILTNAGLLSIRPLGTNFSEIVIKIQNFSFTKLHLKIPSAKWQSFCPWGDELTHWSWEKRLSFKKKKNFKQFAQHNLQIHFYDWYQGYFHWKCTKISSSGFFSQWAKIVSDNDMMANGTKPSN